MRKSTTQVVAENIGAALRTEEVLKLFGDLLLKARFAEFFRPIVRTALAEALDLDPEQIGPDLVEEGVQHAITAGYLASKWLKEERIPQMASELQTKYAEQYEGFENDEVAGQIARDFLIVRDEEMILGNAVSDGLLKKRG